MLMACLDMYNSDHKKSVGPPMSPRISFSNDFVQPNFHHDRSSKEAPVSSDFEFCVSNYSMMSADELFFKGRLLPFKDTNCANQMQRMTLRDELLVDDHNDDVYCRPPRGNSVRWKGLLGLKRAHIGSKKSEKRDGSVERMGDGKRSSLPSKSTPQGSDGGTSCKAVESEI